MTNATFLDAKRLVIRPISKMDAKYIFGYRSDKSTNQFQGWIPVKIEDVYAFIKKTSANFNVEDTWFQFVIINKESNKIIGDIGIHFLNGDNNQVEIGCTLGKSYQGKGYAFEALTRIIDFLFKDYNKHRITASIDPENIASIKLFEKLGFRKEAHFKESILIGEKWVDDLVYAMLQNEWK
jgi:RimJ/RimL family protein N-acetyltransferase